MRILAYSAVNAHTIAKSMGVPEYSYFFVLKEFLPVLQTLGEVIIVENPTEEVDRLAQQAEAEGRRCIFFSFSPPHKTPLGLKCTTVPVFAWEFSSIPTDAWFGDQENDWRNVLRLCGSAIAHSQHTVQAVKDAMGSEFPVFAIPAPVWDRFEQHRGRHEPGLDEDIHISISNGVLLDTRDLSLAPYIPDESAVIRSVARARASENFSDALDPPLEKSPDFHTIVTTWPQLFYRHFADMFSILFMSRPMSEPLAPHRHEVATLAPLMDSEFQQPALQPGPHRLKLRGVVFTSIFNPYDARKNWEDMISAFCAAFRDREDATLLFKLGHSEYQSAMNDMLMCIARLPEFKCRIVLIHGFLDNAAYHALINATDFIVNASYGEGQCLPLMEFMSCGIPAVAPDHSGMEDYMDASVGFLVESWQEITAWPHDPRQAYRTLRYRINWESLVNAYKNAYDCIKFRTDDYKSMALNAALKMQRQCSHLVAKNHLQQYMEK